MQSRQQQAQQCRDFIRAHMRGQRTEGIACTMAMQEAHGIRVDWHMMSDALEYLAGTGEAKRDGFGPDRMAAYVIS